MKARAIAQVCSVLPVIPIDHHRTPMPQAKRFVSLTA
jgi:hypothetical protein